MLFTFRADKPLPHEIRRIAFVQLDAIEKQLGLIKHDRQNAIHDMRKHIKRIRALLRLLDLTFGKRRLKTENRRYRDIARLFALQRDADALLETFDRLSARLSGAFPELDLPSCRMALLSRQNNVALLDLKHQTKIAHKSLILARDAMDNAPLKVTPRQLCSHYQQTSRQAKRVFAVVMNQSSTEHFHEWRKVVKDLLYQSELMKECGSHLLKKDRNRLEQLTEILGDHNDASEMIIRIKMEPDLLGEQTNTGALEVFLEQYREELGHEAKLLGVKIFASSSKLLSSEY